MHNVNFEVDGDLLRITVDLSPHTIAAAMPSGSGKTRLVASTSGFIQLPPANGVKLSLGLNVTAR